MRPGSLLKIKEDLQDAIRQGQEEWEERLPLFRYTEYGLSDEPKERLVRFVQGDVEGERITFWDKAEALVRKALDEFRFVRLEGWPTSETTLCGGREARAWVC